MYHYLEEVPDTTPHLMHSRQTKNEARKATQALIKRHLEALAEFGEEELETALLMEGYMQAAVDDNESSVEGQQQDSVDMSLGSAGDGEEEESDRDEQENMIVRSHKYKQGLTSMKMHDAGVQGKMGG